MNNKDVFPIKQLIEQGESNPPWETEEGKKVWKTKSQYFVWLRGQIRKIWSDYPVRKQWKISELRPVTEEERKSKIFHPSTKNVGQCVFCKSWMAGSKLECDHIVESEGCYDFDTAEKFLWHCAAQNGENFQLVCKPCHKIKSYADSKGISFEEARVQKEAIAIQKKDDKAWIESKGFVPESNQTKRREQIVKILRDENT